MKELTIINAETPLPSLIASAGDRTAYHFLEFFTTQIRNPNTRRAYAQFLPLQIIRL